MKITTREKREILAGELKKLRRPTHPKVEKGEKIILSQTKASAQVVPDQHNRNEAARDDKGNPIVVKAEALPDAWITVESIYPKKGGGGWTINFTLTDRRDKPLYLARNVSDGGDYTTGGSNAADELEVLDPDAQKKIDMDRRLKAAEAKEEPRMSELAMRNQERAVRQYLRETCRDLDPRVAQEWLARVQREGEKAKAELKDAA